MLNIATVQGRFVSSPELRTTNTGVAVCSFTLAVEKDRPNADGTRGADYIDCVAWRQTAEFVARHMDKGQMVIVSGRLQRRKWEDKQGVTRYATDIVAESVYFAGGGKDNALTGADFAEISDSDEELPF